MKVVKLLSGRVPHTGITYSASANSLTITGSGTEAAADKFYKCILSTNTPAGAGCDATTAAIKVTTVADPTLTQPSNVTICKGGSTTLTTTASNGTGTFSYQWQYCSTSGGTYANVANGTPTGITYSASANSLTITGDGTEATADKFYKCILTSATPTGAGCNATTTPVTITTVADPTLSQPSNVTICKGGSTTLTTTASNGTGTFSYQWQYCSTSGGSYANVANGTPTGITYSASANSLTITGAGTETAADKFYKCVLTSATPTGAGCDATTTAITVTTVADPSLSQPSDVTICSGGATTLTTTASNGTGTFSYQWQYCSTSGGSYANVANGTPTGITYSASANSLTITGDGTEATADKFYKCVLTSATPTGAGCDATTTAIKVTTVADPTWATNTISPTTICAGGQITFSATNSGGSGGSVSWTRSASSGGSGTTVTSPHTEATAGTFYYRPVYNPSVNGCDLSDGTETEITVVADPTLSQPSDVTICKGGTTTLSTTASDGTGTFLYQWKYCATSGGTYNNVSDGTPSGITYTDATTTDLIITGDGTETPANNYYICVLSTDTPTDGGCNASTTPINVITVYDPSLSATNLTNTTICAGGSTVASSTLSYGTGTVGYQWQYSTDNLSWSSVSNSTPTGATYTNATSASMTIAGITAANTYYYRLSATSTGNGCTTPVYSTSASLTVANDPSLSQPSDITVCVGSGITLTTAPTGGTGTFSYQWQYSTSLSGSFANVVTGTPTGITYTNGTTASLSITGSGSETPGNSYYQCLLTTNTPSGGGCDAATTVVTVTTVADPTLSTPSDVTICAGGATTLSTTASDGTGTFSYQWVYSTSSSGTYAPVVTGTPAGITYSGETTLDLTITGSGSESAADKYYKCVLTSNTPAGGGCNATTTAIKVTTVADPTLSQPSNVNICKGGNTMLTTSETGGTGTFSYQWQYCATSGGTYADVSDGTPSGITYLGGTTTSLTITGDGTELAADKYYKCVLTSLTPVGGGCGATTTAVKVTTVLDPSWTSYSLPSPTNLCVGSAVFFSVSVSDGLGGTLTWIRSDDATPGAGTEVQVTSPDVPGLGTWYYRPHYAPTGSGCDLADGTQTTVTAVANPSALTAPTAQSTCSNSSVPITFYSVAAGSGADEIEWATNSSFTSSTVVASPADITVTPSAPTSVPSVVTVYIRSKSSTTSCVSSFVSTTATINPVPAVNSSDAGAICSGVAQNYSIGSTVTGSSYSWGRVAVTGISNSTVSGQTSNPILESLTNTTTSPVDAIYLITPTENGCSGSAFTYTVTVNPTPSVNSSTSGTICSGVAQNYLIGSSVTGSSYSWGRVVVTGISNTTVSGQTDNPITEILNNTTTSPVDVIYRITPTANSCPGSTSTYTVTVNPAPQVTTANTKSICSGANTTISLGATVASSFTWTLGTVSSSVSGASSSSGPGTSINQTLTNSDNVIAGTVPYIITPTATLGSCAGSNYTITVTVNPLPDAGITNNSGTGVTVLTCTQTPINLTATGGGTYQWASSTNPLFSSASHTISVTTPATYTVTVSYSTLCSSTASLAITQSSTPPSTGITNNTGVGVTNLTCSTPSISVTATPAGAASYKWSGGSSPNSAGNTLTAAGTYTVTVTTANGCAATSDIAITEGRPTATIAYNPTTVFCNGSHTVLDASVSLGGYGCSTPTYEWFLNGASTGKTHDTCNATIPGIYKVKVTCNSCTTVSDSVEIAVQSSSFALTQTAPVINGLATNDYIWTGSTSTNYETGSNWVTYNSSPSAFTIASNAPDTSKNVFIRANGACITNTAYITDSVTCKNITIETPLTMSGTTAKLNVYGNFLASSSAFTASTGIVVFLKALATQTLNTGGNAFNNILHNGAGTLQLITNPLVTDGTFTNSAGNFDANGLANTVTGLTTLSGGNYLAKTGTQSFNGGVDNNGGTITGLSGTINATDVTISSGTVTATSGSYNVSGNWLKTGGTFGANNGTVTFNGSGQQTITSGGGTFNNVTLNNQLSGSNDIVIADPMVINGAGTFTKGIVTYSGTGALTFGTNATTSGSSAASFVSGKVTKTGVAAFTYPVGDASSYMIFAPIGIEAHATSDISAQYKFAHSHYECWDPYSMCDLTQINHCSDIEHWEMESSQSGVYPGVTLYWNPASGIDHGITTPSDIIVAHWTGSCWESMGGTATGSVSAGSISSSIAFSHYSDITIGSKGQDNPLPINLLYFNAKCDNNKVDVSWSTATETNNDHFTVERSSDAQNWQFLRKIAGAGNSNAVLNYNITDANPLGGISYYRLKQTDFDGQSETFSPAAVSCSADADKASVSYFPNPFTSEVVVDLKNITSENAVINVYDVFGSKVFTKILSQEDLERKTVSLNLGGLARGMYTVEFHSDSYSGTDKLIKN